MKPVRSPRKSGNLFNYETIRRNIYIHGINPRQDFDNTQGFCTCTKKCGESCINVLSRIECTSENCILKAKLCGNRNFSKVSSVATKIDKSPGKGYGLFTTVDISKNTFIKEYVGEVIDDIELGNRLWEKKRNNQVK